MFAIGLMRHSDVHVIEACQIGSRSGYQGCQACDKVQWFEDDVGSTVVVRCFQLLFYDYLTGPRFRHRDEAIVEKVSGMQTDLDREKKAMTRLCWD